MAEHAVIDEYLTVLRQRLAWRSDVGDLLAEVEDHLLESMDRLRSQGLSVRDAEERTLDAFGDPTVIATAFATTTSGRIATPSRATRLAGTVGIAAGAGWTVLAMISVMDSAWSSGPLARMSWLYQDLLPITGMLTAGVLAGLAVRSGRFRDVQALAVFSLAVCGLIVMVTMADNFLLWMSLLTAASALAARMYATVCYFPSRATRWAMTWSWTLALAPLLITQLLLPGIENMIPVFLPVQIAWYAGWVLYGAALFSCGRRLWQEKATEERFRPETISLS